MFALSMRGVLFSDQDEQWVSYMCPLGKRTVDFADEPAFGRTVM